MRVVKFVSVVLLFAWSNGAWACQQEQQQVQPWEKLATTQHGSRRRTLLSYKSSRCE
jgi:hypothetical protein